MLSYRNGGGGMSNWFITIFWDWVYFVVDNADLNLR
jgi:hypothetical protein